MAANSSAKKKTGRQMKSIANPVLILLFPLLLLGPVSALAAPTGERPLGIFFANDVRGEMEPCG